MDNNKVRLNITIDQSTKEYIDKVKKEKNLRSQSQAIDYIIMQERENDNVDVLADCIVDKIKTDTKICLHVFVLELLQQIETVR